MTPMALTLSPTEALNRLTSLLDLTNVRVKLADPDEGHGCSPTDLDRMETEYRKFLALHLMFPDSEIVPCKMVDTIWHQHILDTVAYRKDCDVIFGDFLDHFPYFGMRGDEDAQALADAWEDTLDRYRAAFGEPPEDTWIAREAAHCRRTACKPQKCK